MEYSPEHRSDDQQVALERIKLMQADNELEMLEACTQVAYDGSWVDHVQTVESALEDEEVLVLAGNSSAIETYLMTSRETPAEVLDNTTELAESYFRRLSKPLMEKRFSLESTLSWANKSADFEPTYSPRPNSDAGMDISDWENEQLAGQQEAEEISHILSHQHTYESDIEELASLEREISEFAERAKGDSRLEKATALKEFRYREQRVAADQTN